MLNQIQAPLYSELAPPAIDPICRNLGHDWEAVTAAPLRPDPATYIFPRTPPLVIAYRCKRCPAHLIR